MNTTLQRVTSADGTIDRHRAPGRRPARRPRLRRLRRSRRQRRRGGHPGLGLQRPQLRSPRSRRQRRHAAVRHRARDRGHRGRHRARQAARPGCAARRRGPPWRCAPPPPARRSRKLALWEPPYILDPAARPPADQIEQYETMVAEGRRGDAAEYFMAKVVGMPPDFVAYAKSQPWWANQEALAHTLAYDARIMGDYSVPVDDRGQGDRADARPRWLGEHALHEARAPMPSPRRCPMARAGPSPTRDTTSMPPSWRPCWPSSSAANAARLYSL